MLDPLKKLWSNKFIKGGVFFTASSFLINLMNYLFNLIAGRSLGPQGYGDLTALFSYLSVVTVPVVVLSNFVIQKVAGNTNDAIVAKSLENLFWEKMKKLAGFFILLIFLFPFLAKLTNLSFFLSISLIILIILTLISSMYGSLLQGLKLFFIYSLLGTLGTLIKLTGAFAVLFGFDGIATIINFIFLSAVLGIFVNIWIFRSHINSRFKKIQNFPRIEKKLIQLFKNRQFQLIFFSTLALTLFSNADVVFVKKYFSPVEAGIYGSWSLFSKIIFYTLGPFIGISFIFFSSRQDRSTVKQTLNLSLIALFIIGITSFFAYKYLTIPIINLFFGSKFYAVAPYLMRASLFGTLYTGVTFLNNFFLAKKSEFSFILFISVFFYIFLLFFIEKNLWAVMNLNIVISASLFIIYLFLYFKFYLINSKS